SRRRHTRFSRDWSSDVCSSDLAAVRADQLQARAAGIDETAIEDADHLVLERQRSCEDDVDAARPGDLLSPGAQRLAAEQPERVEIGRASRRERDQTGEATHRYP